MIKLHYVVMGDVVEFTYLVSLLVEAKLKGCNILLFKVHHSLGTSEHDFGDTGVTNKIVDWLINNHPNEYGLEQ